jgi:hypothetical protein
MANLDRPGFDRERRICRVAAKGHRYEYGKVKGQCTRARPYFRRLVPYENEAARGTTPDVFRIWMNLSFEVTMDQRGQENAMALVGAEAPVEHGLALRPACESR